MESPALSPALAVEVVLTTQVTGCLPTEATCIQQVNGLLSGLTPFVIEDGEKTLSYLIAHKMSDMQRYKAYNLMKKAFHCNECAERYANLCCLVDQHGSIFAKFKDVPSHYPRYKHLRKMAKFAESVVHLSYPGYNCNGMISLCSPIVMNHELKSGGFEHIVCSVSPSDISTCDEDRGKLIQECMSRYLVSGLFEGLVNRLIFHGKSSLELMKTYLEKTCHDDLLIPSILWCEGILSDWNDCVKRPGLMTSEKHFNFALRHIIRAKLEKNSFGSVALLFQTTQHSIINFLDCAGLERTMNKLCVEHHARLFHLEPLNRTTEEQIAKAVGSFGNVKSCILTVEEATSLIPQIVHHGKARENPCASSSKELASTFASRCEQSSLEMQIKNIKTLREFVEFARRETLHVEIENYMPAVAYLASTSLDAFHCFIKDEVRTGILGLNLQWYTVLLTVPMFEIDECKNVLFVIDGYRPTRQKCHCCCREFLGTICNSMNHTIYNKYYHTTNVVVPNGSLMVGLGTSVKDSEGTLCDPIDLRVNGIRLRLTKL